MTRNRHGGEVGVTSIRRRRAPGASGAAARTGTTLPSAATRREENAGPDMLPSGFGGSSPITDRGARHGNVASHVRCKPNRGLGLVCLARRFLREKRKIFHVCGTGGSDSPLSPASPGSNGTVTSRTGYAVSELTGAGIRTPRGPLPSTCARLAAKGWRHPSLALLMQRSIYRAVRYPTLCLSSGGSLNGVRAAACGGGSPHATQSLPSLFPPSSLPPCLSLCLCGYSLFIPAANASSPTPSPTT